MNTEEYMNEEIMIYMKLNFTERQYMQRRPYIVEWEQ